MVYALIKDGKVENMIVADEAFISKIQAQWEHCVRVDNLDVQPSIGWDFDGSDFSDPALIQDE